MVERIRDVLLELGNGFSFIGNQYKLTVGDNDYFIDMLFCFSLDSKKINESDSFILIP